MKFLASFHLNDHFEDNWLIVSANIRSTHRFNGRVLGAMNENIVMTMNLKR